MDVEALTRRDMPTTVDESVDHLVAVLEPGETRAVSMLQDGLVPNYHFSLGLQVRPECRRARDTFWDVQVPKMTALGDSLWAPVRPASVALRRHHRKLDAGFAPLPQVA